MRELRDRIARALAAFLIRKLLIDWRRLTHRAPSAWRIAYDDEQFTTLLAWAAWTFEPTDTDRVCMTCLDRRIRELPSKHEQGIHGRRATDGPPRRDMEHWRP